MKPLIVFATGGSGGHIFPALAIAKEASSHYRVAFIGSKTGMEAELIPEAGFEFYGVSTGKWNRTRLNPLVLFSVLTGAIAAIILLLRFKPKLVMGFGGFASFPGIFAARFLGIPYILHEANAFPGKVVRWFAKGAKVLAVTYTECLDYLPKLKKIEVIAFPIREQIIDRLEARRKLNLPSHGLISFVMGGSQGSVFLNTEVPKAFIQLGSSPIILHSTGKKWQSKMQKETATLKNYKVTGFVDAALAWSAADVAICRAGVGTLSEAAFYGVPCIMIPLPSSAENHQLHNARAFEKAGAGWVLEEKNISSLASVWENALDLENLKRASSKSKELSPKGATKEFLALIDSLVLTDKEVSA